MSRETCATCRFWRKNHGIEPAAGFCRRAPKAWVDGAFSGWKQPIMYDDDWCGEHRPAAPDAYTRAAEAWAEASIAAQQLWDALIDGLAVDGAAAQAADVRVGICRDAFLRLYREKHGG